MLTLVGLSQGFVEIRRRRMRGSGADIVVRDNIPRPWPFQYAGETGRTTSSGPPRYQATGVATNVVSGWTTVNGITWWRLSDERKLCFPGRALFEKPDDILLDTFYAQQAHVHAGAK